MNIAVTGATGHVGANLVRTLVDGGHGCARSCTRGNRRGARRRRLRIRRRRSRRPASLERAFDGCERVFHLAARISIVPGDEAAVRAVNVDGTRNVVAACEKTRRSRRLVHFSSIHALSPDAARRRHRRDPRAHLVAAHAAVRSLARPTPSATSSTAIARGLDAIIVNPTAILGPLRLRPVGDGARAPRPLSPQAAGAGRRRLRLGRRARRRLGRDRRRRSRARAAPATSCRARAAPCASWPRSSSR